MGRQKQASWVVIGLVLGAAVWALPAIGHASVGDDITNAVQKFVRFIGGLAALAIVLAWMRVGYTYLWSDIPEKTMERAKHAAIGSVLLMGSYGIGQLFGTLFTTRSI